MAIDVSLRKDLLRPNLNSKSFLAKTGEKLNFSTKSKFQLHSTVKAISLQNNLLKGQNVKSINLKPSLGCQKFSEISFYNFFVVGNFGIQ